MKAHLSAHPRQGFGQEVGTSHPVHERSKRMPSTSSLSLWSLLISSISRSTA
jgi:hypothetical protein